MANSRKNRRNRRNRSLYLLDFDKPAKCPDRQAFYRKLRSPKYRPKKSTKSVLLFDDPKKAGVILKKARVCGAANLYRVKKRESGVQ